MIFLKLILASNSPRRKELIHLITDDVICIPSNADETLSEDIDPESAAEILACRKAINVAENHKNETVLGCDTLVIADGTILGKPKDKDDAKNMLQALSGKTHKVITGCCICNKGKSISFSCCSYVTFWDIEDSAINEYVNSGEPMDKAGSYGIQGKGSLFVKEIHGDYFNIVGLPVSLINRRLCDMGIL